MAEEQGNDNTITNGDMNGEQCPEELEECDENGGFCKEWMFCEVLVIFLLIKAQIIALYYSRMFPISVTFIFVLSTEYTEINDELDTYPRKYDKDSTYWRETERVTFGPPL